MAFAAVLVVAAGFLALTSGRAAFDFMPRLNLQRPPLASAPEIIEPALGPRLARRVVLVMIDGLRLDASYGRPFLDGLRARGVDARAAASFPSFSHPGYVAIVTGVPPRDSGVRNNIYPWAVPLDNVMRRARAAAVGGGAVGGGGGGGACPCRPLAGAGGRGARPAGGASPTPGRPPPGCAASRRPPTPRATPSPRRSPPPAGPPRRSPPPTRAA